MNRTVAFGVIAIVLGFGGLVVAQKHDEGERVKVIGTHEMQEKVDGKDFTATVVEVTIEPGQEGVAHRHPGPGLVYVAEGEYELGIDDQPVKKFKAGQTFYEPTKCLHRVSRNPSKTGKTRLIAFVLHPRDVTEIAVPEKEHK